MTETGLADRLTELGVSPCDDGTQNHDWRTAELGCETCGDHDGFMCDTCYEALDHVWQAEAYEAVREVVGD